MNPIEVFAEGKQIGWMCGACRARVVPRALAEECCVPKACPGCGELLAVGSWCTPCRNIEEDRKEAARFEQAKKVPLLAHDGPLYWDGGPNEGYFSDEEELREALEDLDAEGEARPKYVWACSTEKAEFDLADAISNDLNDNHHEDAHEVVDDAKIVAAQALINEALADVESWHPDYSTAVLVPAKGAA